MGEWKGYWRMEGAPGIRNKVLVIYTVECAAFVAKEIVRRANQRDIEVLGFEGCTDNAYAVRLLLALIRHPNVGAVLVVGLGCEYVQAAKLAETAERSGKLQHYLLIQEEGGSLPSIQKGLTWVEDAKRKLADTKRVAMTPADLTVGAECGGSDFTSGLAGNVVVGKFFDCLTAAGGTAIFEEIVETVGLREYLAERGRTPEAVSLLRQTYDKALEYCKSVRQYSVSPGNFAGGLSTIEEKSMGALVKSGTAPIEGVLKVGERAAHKGLWLLDSTPDPHWMGFGITNPNDNEGLMDLIASGAQIVFLVTGRGNVVGSAVAPVIKLTGNQETYRKMRGDMDFDAGRVLAGECTQEELTAELWELVEQTAAGKLTKAELLRHEEYYIPYKYQETKPCR